MTAQDLSKIANELRIEALKMVHTAGAGHVAGPMSAAEIITALYFGGIVQGKSDDSWNEERDRIVLSCGHYCPIMYAALARNGYFAKELLGRYMRPDGLPGHPEYHSHPGVEATTGSLGQGVSQAVGMALGLKLKYGERAQKDTPRVWCVISDGELEEGQVWEAFNTAVRRQLDNLVFIVDANRVQIEHYLSEVVTMGNPVGRLESFGLYVLEAEGNDIDEMVKRMGQAKGVQGGPVVIVAHTKAGKGVSFMEGKPEWHDKVPSEKELERAIEELGGANS